MPTNSAASRTTATVSWLIRNSPPRRRRAPCPRDQKDTVPHARAESARPARDQTNTPRHTQAHPETQPRTADILPKTTLAQPPSRHFREFPIPRIFLLDNGLPLAFNW